LILAVIAVLTEDLNPLFTAPLRAHLYFVAAGFFHFLIGWTFLNASQKKIGAARTSPLIGTNPVFAAVIAAITLGEIPTWVELIAIGVIVVGAYLVSSENLDTGNENHSTKSFVAIFQASWLGLSAAFFWAVSPIFIRLGLKDLPSPLLGVTIGVTASAVAYGIILLWQRRQWLGEPITGEAWTYKLIAGVLVGLSTWMRWVALDLTSVAVVLALSMISAPVVIVLSPLISGKHLERVTSILLFGTGLILGGALILVLI
jgi:drug/metabolite transporter (DMT)-like permease